MELRDATIEDCKSLAPRLKAQDVLELALTLNADPEQGLIESLQASASAYTLLQDGVPVAMGGYTHGEQGALCWALTDANVRSYGKALTQIAKIFLWALKDGGKAYNYVLKSNTVSICWLERLGFKPEYEVIINQHAFILMSKEVK